MLKTLWVLALFAVWCGNASSSAAEETGHDSFLEREVHFSALGRVSTLFLNAEDRQSGSEASLNSKLGAGIEVSAKIPVMPGLYLGTGIETDFVHFNQPLNRRLAKPHFWVWSPRLSAEYVLHERLSLCSGLSWENLVSLIGDSAGLLILDRFHAPALLIGGKLNLPINASSRVLADFSVLVVGGATRESPSYTHRHSLGIRGQVGMQTTPSDAFSVFLGVSFRHWNDAGSKTLQSRSGLYLVGGINSSPNVPSGPEEAAQ